MIAVDFECRAGTFRLRAAAALADGEPTVVVGSSGAGKSTLLDVVAGLRRPDRGFVRRDAETWVDTDAGVWLPPERRDVGVVFQDRRLFPHLDVRGNLEFARRGAGTGDATGDRAQSRVRVPFDDCVDELALSGILDRRVRELSGGEAARVAIGRALLSSPGQLLLDEPTAGLDAAPRRRVIALVRRLAKDGTPVVWVTHRLTEAQELGGSLLLLDDGKVVGDGPLQSLLVDPDAAALAHRMGFASVLTVEVRGHDTHLTRASVGAADLVLPHLDAAVGESARVALSPHDVVLARAVPEGLSARNALAATVTRVVDLGDRRLVLLDAGQPLAAEVTPASVAELGLEPGASVVALAKAYAFQPL